MKRVLIVGKTSYIGTSFQQYVQRIDGSDVTTDSISVRDNAWKDVNLQNYDAVLYCAALVHQRENPDMAEDYMHINRHLPVAFAQKAKKAGVSQFIYLSTMAVYGQEGKVGKTVIIDHSTVPNPQSLYGKSKWKAEQELQGLQGESFGICILRPPMVYGPDCPGNYQKLKGFILKYKVFPTIKNQRSMISVDRLCAILFDLIQNCVSGVLHPQDPEYICTLDMAQKIADDAGIRLYLCPLLNPVIRLGGLVHPAFGKVWGGLVYGAKLT